MTDTTSAPRYALRGLQLIGWRDMQHALDFLFADGQMKSGTLVAINAEKMLAVEDNAEVKSLIEAALMCLAWRVLTFGSGLWSAQALKARRYF